MIVMNILEADRAGVGDRVILRGRHGGTLRGAASAGVVIVLDDGTRAVVPWHEAAEGLDVIQR